MRQALGEMLQRVGAFLLIPALCADSLPVPRGIPGRGGFFYGSCVLVVMLLGYMAARQPANAASRPGAKLRIPITLAALFLLISLVGIFIANTPSLAVAALARNALVLGILFGSLWLGISRPQHWQTLLRPLAMGAAAWVFFLVGLYVAAAVWPTLQAGLFELGSHQHVGSLRRFQGTMSAPGGLGFHLIAVMALIWVCGDHAQESAKDQNAQEPSAGGIKTWQTLALIAAAALCVLTFSFATLTLPLIAVPFLSKLRKTTALVMSLVAATLLLTNPLELRMGDARIELGRLHPAYQTQGLGPKLTPIHDLQLGPIGAKFHVSHYVQVVDGGLRCLSKSPWLGVGGLGYANACKVKTMDSYGHWAYRRAHNQWIAVLVEHGLVGVLLFMALGLALWRWGRMDHAVSASKGRRLYPLATGCLGAYLLCTLQGENLLQPVFAIWLGTWLPQVRRSALSAVVPGCPSCAQPCEPTTIAWLFSCATCGHYAASPQSQRAPGQTSALNAANFHRDTESLRQANLETVWEVLRAHRPAAHGCLLDIGCGDGLLLSMASEQGHAIYGIEPDREAYDLAKTRCPAATLSAVPFTAKGQENPHPIASAGPFDIIMFNHSLEHFDEPAQVVPSLLPLLSPSGRIVVHGPKSGGIVHHMALFAAWLGIQAPLRRMWWLDFDSPVYHRFSVASLRALMAKNGLDEMGQGTSDALRLKGLWPRLRADRSMGFAKVCVWMLATMALWPVLAFGPKDYVIQIFQRSGAAQPGQ